MAASLFSFLNILLCLCVCVGRGCHRRPEKGIKSLEAGVAGSCVPPWHGCREQNSVLPQAESTLFHNVVPGSLTQPLQVSLIAPGLKPGLPRTKAPPAFFSELGGWLELITVPQVIQAQHSCLCFWLLFLLSSLASSSYSLCHYPDPSHAFTCHISLRTDFLVSRTSSSLTPPTHTTHTPKAYPLSKSWPSCYLTQSQRLLPRKGMKLPNNTTYLLGFFLLLEFKSTQPQPLLHLQGSSVFHSLFVFFIVLF